MSGKMSPERLAALRGMASDELRAEALSNDFDGYYMTSRGILEGILLGRSLKNFEVSVQINHILTLDEDDDVWNKLQELLQELSEELSREISK